MSAALYSGSFTSLLAGFRWNPLFSMEWKMATNDHGHCPHCNTDLNGDSIWQTGVHLAWEGKDGAGLTEGKAKTQEEAEARADTYASLYGASRTEGRWGRQIGIYDMEKDRTVRWKCPDCNHQWPR